jgi:hypothetical protein
VKEAALAEQWQQRSNKSGIKKEDSLISLTLRGYNPYKNNKIK